MAFPRTPSGNKAKFLFYKLPLIWVEGPTDVPIYRLILRGHSCRIEIAHGKENCLDLATGITELDLPYVVVMDGDYDILWKERSNHRRVVLLSKYSIENYIANIAAAAEVFNCYEVEEDAVQEFINRYNSVFSDLESQLLVLLVLDVTHYRKNTDISALPKRIDSLLENPPAPCICIDRVTEACSDAMQEIDETDIAESRNLIDQFLTKRHFTDLLNGHLVFGMVRCLIIDELRKRKKKPHIDNIGLTMLLTHNTWTKNLSTDHLSLRRRLLSAISEVRKLRFNPNDN